VVDPEDLDGMVDHLSRLVEDGGLRRTMGEAARVRCVDRFSIAAVGALWLRVLTPLLPSGIGATDVAPGSGRG
jgi:glycosyltransferase involved in cell wall biosynthesis